MRRRFALIGLTVALVGAFAGATSQHAPLAPASGSAASVADSAIDAGQILARVAFVGASATAGFGVVAKDPEAKLPLLPVPLAASFEGVIDRPIETYDLGSSFFFMNPAGTGRSAIDRTVGHRATLVVAVDFLFWYVYGSDDGKGNPLPNEAARLQKLELGLMELDRIVERTPIVVGDLPDMHRAVGKMITQAQMPAAETLAKANERIHAWANARPQTISFPLAALVEALNAGKPLTIAGLSFDPRDGAMLQSDELHPTFRGSVAVAFALAERLQSTYGDALRATLVATESVASDEARQAARAALMRRAKRTTAPAPN